MRKLIDSTRLCSRYRYFKAIMNASSKRFYPLSLLSLPVYETEIKDYLTYKAILNELINISQFLEHVKYDISTLYTRFDMYNCS